MNILMEHLCVNLDLKIPLIKEEDLKKKYIDKRHKLIDINDLSEEFCELIKLKNLRFRHAQVFYLTPFSYMEVHRDKEFLEDFPKMNFVFGGEGSVMKWFKPNSKSNNNIKSTPLGIPYLSYKPSEVELIYQQVIAQPSIVQAGIPHNVINLSRPRQCFSFVFENENQELLTFKNLVNLFSEYRI